MIPVSHIPFYLEHLMLEKMCFSRTFILGFIVFRSVHVPDIDVWNQILKGNHPDMRLTM